VESWKQIYDIDISPEEIPLLKIKMVNSENSRFENWDYKHRIGCGDYRPAK